MHTNKRRRLPDLSRAAEQIRNRIAEAGRAPLGSGIDEVARRRQSLGEIGGRIVSIRRLWRELVLSTAQQLAPTDLSLAQVAALYLLADGRARNVAEIAAELGRSHSATSRLVAGLVTRKLLRVVAAEDSAGVCTYLPLRARRCSRQLIADARNSLLVWCVGFPLQSAD